MTIPILLPIGDALDPEYFALTHSLTARSFHGASSQYADFRRAAPGEPWVKVAHGRTVGNTARVILA